MGNTIDLAFSNIPAAHTTIEQHLDVLSDHATLSTTVPAADFCGPRNQSPKVTTEDELRIFQEVVAKGSPHLPAARNTPEELDDLAHSIATLLIAAAKVAGRPPSKGSSGGTTWWSEACDEDHTLYVALRRAERYGADVYEEVSKAKKALKRTICRAKRDFWRQIVEEAADHHSIYKIMRWTKASGPFRPPPLQVGEQVFVTDEDRARALREALLERKNTLDDVQDPGPAPTGDSRCHIRQAVSLRDARAACIGVGNTSPGGDGITVRMLQAAWRHVGGHVRALYEACLAQGYHPKCFRHAEVVMIPKPGRRDLTTVKA
jgi:hypothetical protein